MSVKATLMVNPSTGAITAPVTATTFRNSNGLQIGVNIQAWSADLDSFVTNASWSTDVLIIPALSVNGDIVTSGSFDGSGSAITNLNASQLVSGTVPNARLDAQLQSIITGNFGTPTSIVLSNGTGLPLSTGITGTLGYGNGGTNATTQASARTNLGGQRYGFADGTAVLASTPEFIGQWSSANDGYVAIARGTSAGALNPFAVSTNGTTYLLQNIEINNGSLSVSTASAISLISTHNSTITIRGANATDDAVSIGNTNATGYSAVRFVYNGDSEGKMAVGVGNSGSSAHFSGSAYIQAFDEDGTSPSVDLKFFQFGKYGGSSSQDYERMKFQGSNGDIFLRPLTAGTLAPTAALFIAGSTGMVGVGTESPASIVSNGGRTVHILSTVDFPSFMVERSGGRKWAMGVGDNSGSGSYAWLLRNETAGSNVVVVEGGAPDSSVVMQASVIALGNPVKLKSYTVVGVPSAATAGAGAMIYVSNETGGAVPAFSDATNWRRVTDRAIIS